MVEGLSEASSRDRFLAAADDQFIISGYDRCTIRAIAARAGTSIASLSRNWSNKDELFTEVFRRHFDPIHAAQNASFDMLEARGNTSARAVIEAFFGSAMARGQANLQKSHRIYSLAMLDPSDGARTITRRLAEPVRQRLTRMLRHCLPGLDEKRFFLAMSVVLGSYIYTLARGERLAAVMDYDITTMDWDDAVRLLADMVCGGIAE